MFVFISISPTISLPLNIQFLTDDKREKKSRALMLVAISHYKANVDSFHVVVLSSDMGWCTFNFCYQQARVLRLLDLVKWQVSQNQRITSSVQTGVGSCIFKGGRLTCRTLLRRLKLLMLVRWQLKKAEPWLWRQQKRQIACVVNACFCQQER